MKQAWFLSLLLGLAHGFSDASAGFLLGRTAFSDFQYPANLWLTYNLLAFGGMPLAGLLSDHLHHPKQVTLMGLAATATGLVVSGLSLPAAISLAAVGSALFHAGGGSLALANTPGKASGPGLFAAFGVLGLAIGSQQGIVPGSPFWPYLAGILILVISIAFHPVIFQNLATHPVPLPGYENLVVLVVLAVALRSVIWTSSQYAIGGSSQVLLVAGTAMLAKLFGGFLSDKAGWKIYLPGVLAVSMVFLIFGQTTFALLLAGIFLMQSTIPASIALLAQILPDRPGLAASLVLGPALLLGGIPPMLGMSSLMLSPVAILSALTASAVFYWLIFRQIALKTETE